MNSIDRLTEKILNDATDEAGNIIKVAQDKATSILNKYEIEANECYDEIITQAHQKENELLKHKSDMAHLEGRKQLLFTKQTILDEVFIEAFNRIKQLDGDIYKAFLSKIAASNSINGSGSLIFSTSDKSLIGENVVERANIILMNEGRNANLTLSGETRNINGGFIIKADEIEVNCTFDALYNIKRNELAFEVAQQLFSN